MKNAHDDLSLERLLLAAKALIPDEEVIIYYDPDTHYFIIASTDVLAFFLPRGIRFIFRGLAKDVGFGIETFISDALRKLEKGAQA